jgi:hypothetical protein
MNFRLIVLMSFIVSLNSFGQSVDFDESELDNWDVEPLSFWHDFESENGYRIRSILLFNDNDRSYGTITNITVDTVNYSIDEQTHFFQTKGSLSERISVDILEERSSSYYDTQNDASIQYDEEKGLLFDDIWMEETGSGRFQDFTWINHQTFDLSNEVFNIVYGQLFEDDKQKSSVQCFRSETDESLTEIKYFEAEDGEIYGEYHELYADEGFAMWVLFFTYDGGKIKVWERDGEMSSELKSVSKPTVKNGMFVWRDKYETPAIDCEE